MQKIRTIEELREAIRDLEHQDYVNQQHMRNKVNAIADRLKPVNIIKSLFGHFLGRSDTKTSVFKLAAGLATSFVVKKLFKKTVPLR